MAEHDYIQETTSQRLRNWILVEMLRGAGYVAVVLLGIGAIIAVIYLVSLALPDDSKTEPGPMPFSTLQAAPAPAQG